MYRTRGSHESSVEIDPGLKSHFPQRRVDTKLPGFELLIYRRSLGDARVVQLRLLAEKQEESVLIAPEAFCSDNPA